jgi:hypothetical protein
MTKNSRQGHDIEKDTVTKIFRIEIARSAELKLSSLLFTDVYSIYLYGISYLKFKIFLLSGLKKFYLAFKINLPLQFEKQFSMYCIMYLLCRWFPSGSDSHRYPIF